MPAVESTLGLQLGLSAFVKQPYRDTFWWSKMSCGYCTSLNSPDLLNGMSLQRGLDIQDSGEYLGSSKFKPLS